MQPTLKAAQAPAKPQFNLAAEAGMPADMIAAYLPQREQQSIPAGLTLLLMCDHVHLNPACI